MTEEKLNKTAIACAMFFLEILWEKGNQVNFEKDGRTLNRHRVKAIRKKSMELTRALNEMRKP